jgi:glycosyltransferase involved in cell wall biosynthesis
MVPGVTGLIADCTSPEPVATAVTEILIDRKLEDMSQAARAWVVDRFDWSSLASEAADLFGMIAKPIITAPRTLSASRV